MRAIVRWAGAALLLLSSAVSAQGQGYATLPTPVPTESDTVEVREFFSYACPHCFTFMPLFDAWKQKKPEGVTVARTAVAFNEQWVPLAEAYYVAEVLGVVDKLHRPLFEAVHRQGRSFNDRQAVTAFFVEHGVSKEQVDLAYSFHINRLMAQGEQAVKNHRISSTPSVVVNGKYLVSPRTAGGHKNMIDVIDRLVRQELNAKK